MSLLTTVLGGLDRAKSTVLGGLTSNMSALDVLGASVAIFTDKATVTSVQKALAALPSAKLDPVFQLVVDGIIGPKTAAALSKFNGQYRGEPDDGAHITEGTLAALKLPPSDAPSGTLENATVTSVPVTPVAKRPTLTLVPPDTRVATVTMPAAPERQPWEIALAAGAVGLAGLGIYLALR